MGLYLLSLVLFSKGDTVIVGDTNYYYADHCFLSTVGLDVEVGLTTLDIIEAQLNRRMMESAAQVTVLADSSKFGHRSLSLISDFRSVQRVITDTNAPSADIEKLRGRGIEVILA